MVWPKAWRALMSLAFIPLYVNNLGTDAMSLAGLFALLQAWLAVVDLVIRSALWDNAAEIGNRLQSGGGNAVDTQPAVDRNKPAPAGVSGKPTGQMPEYAQHIFRTKTMWCIA